LQAFHYPENTLFFVIPAPHQVRDKLQPGSSIFDPVQNIWIPAFAGMTTFYETVNVQREMKNGTERAENQIT